MATYLELNGLITDGDLYLKIKVACFVAADIIMSEPTSTTNHANRVLWANRVYASPEIESKKMQAAVLAHNRTLTVAQIQSAIDSDIQSAVNTIVDLFAVAP